MLQKTLLLSQAPQAVKHGAFILKALIGTFVFGVFRQEILWTLSQHEV